jgi:hypothetical protein
MMPGMGTWDIGHFDNDAAADFGGSLDDSAPQERVELLREALRAVVEEPGYLDSHDAARAVAAAALVAAQCPGGAPVTTVYGPDGGIPPLPDELRGIAVRALDRVVGDDSEMLDLWAEAGEATAWCAGVDALRAVLGGAVTAG